jgi:hypothetical protein
MLLIHQFPFDAGRRAPPNARGNSVEIIGRISCDWRLIGPPHCQQAAVDPSSLKRTSSFDHGWWLPQCGQNDCATVSGIRSRLCSSVSMPVENSLFVTGHVIINTPTPPPFPPAQESSARRPPDHDYTDRSGPIKANDERMSGRKQAADLILSGYRSPTRTCARKWTCGIM